MGCKYDWISETVGGFSAVRVNGKYGFINNDFREICPIKYDMVGRFRNGMAPVEMNGEKYYIDSNGVEHMEVRNEEL